MTTERITKALDAIPDDFKLKERKSGDTSMNLIIGNYNELASTNSSLMEINEESTGKDLKEAVEALPYEDKIRLMYEYLSDTGRISSDAGFNKDINRFKVRALHVGSITLLIMFVLVVGGVVVSGIYRGELNSNEVTNFFMRLVNNVVNIFFGAKPVVE